MTPRQEIANGPRAQGEDQMSEQKTCPFKAAGAEIMWAAKMCVPDAEIASPGDMLELLFCTPDCALWVRTVKGGACSFAFIGINAAAQQGFALWAGPAEEPPE